MKLPFKTAYVKSVLFGALLGVLILGPAIKMLQNLPDAGSEKEDMAVLPAFAVQREDDEKLSKEERVCYLTFDDGPSENTKKVLDLLDAYHIKATFFVVGQELKPEREGLIRRMIEGGHAIGMHANEHRYEKIYADRESFFKDYEILYRTLKENYGLSPSIYRFPGGSVCTCLHGNGKRYIRELKEKGFLCFDWNVSGEDAVGTPSAGSIQRNVLSKGLSCRRAIVLLHDSNMADKTVEALPGIIEAFQKAGFTFDTLDHTESYVFPASR